MIYNKLIFFRKNFGARFLFLLFLIGFFLFSCDLQKRRYRPGYHKEQPTKPSTVAVNTANPEIQKPVPQGDTAKHLSSPFIADESQENYSSKPCDTIYFNDGRKITAVYKEKTHDEVKYIECNTEGPAYSIYKTEINTIKRANGTSVDLTEEKTPTLPDSLGCDKIYFKDGKEKQVHVVETTNDEIKYKECGDRDGIAYSVYKKEAIMIKRANGTYDVISTSISEPEKTEDPKSKGPTRNKGLAVVLCLLLGAYGIHRFYLGYTVMGVIYFLTAGFCFIGVIIDLIRILTGDLKPKNGRYAKGGGGIPL